MQSAWRVPVSNSGPMFLPQNVVAKCVCVKSAPLLFLPALTRTLMRTHADPRGPPRPAPTRALTRTHADPTRGPGPTHSHGALTRTHADTRGPLYRPAPTRALYAHPRGALVPALTRTLTPTHTDADPRGPTREAPVPVLTRPLTRIHVDADPRGRPTARTHAGTDADPRGPTRGPGPRTDADTDTDTDADPRGPFPALTRTPTRTHAGPGTLAAKSLDASPRKRSEGGVEVAPRGSASVSAWVRVGVRVSPGRGPRVGPRGCPRQCGEGSPRGFAWVRVSVCVGAGSGPRVGPRGSVLVPGGCGIWVCVRP